MILTPQVNYVSINSLELLPLLPPSPEPVGADSPAQLMTALKGNLALFCVAWRTLYNVVDIIRAGHCGSLTRCVVAGFPLVHSHFSWGACVGGPQRTLNTDIRASGRKTPLRCHCQFI